MDDTAARTVPVDRPDLGGRVMTVAEKIVVSSLEAPGRSSERYVLFAVGDVEYAVGAATVRRFLPPGDMSSPAEFRNEASPRLIDLRRCFRVAGGSAARPMLLVEGRHGLATLLVDAILSVASIAAQSVQELPPAFGGAERHWFQGIARLADRVVVLIDVDGLLS
jgi:purine-binding chemotaxis protein CheW